MNKLAIKAKICKYMVDHGIEMDISNTYPNDHGNIFFYYKDAVMEYENEAAFKRAMAKDIINSERRLKLSNCFMAWDQTCQQEVDDLKTLFNLLYGKETLQNF